MGTCQISAEALTLGSKLGLSTSTMYDVITSSLSSNDHLKTYWPTKVLKGDVTPGFAIDLAYKDLSIGVSVRQRRPACRSSQALPRANA